MANIQPTIYHLGVDETTIGMPSRSHIVTTAQTTNGALVKDLGFEALKKAKNYIHEAEKEGRPIRFPTYNSMLRKGLEAFHWTKVCGGRFKPRELQHASIAHVVQTNGYKPHNTVIHIDAFENRHDKTRYLIQEFLHRRGFEIPHEHIIVWGGGDKCIPIINMADILGAVIGYSLNNKYHMFNPSWKKVEFEEQEVPFEDCRTKSLSPEDRDNIEVLINSWKNHDGRVRKIRKGK